MNEPPIAAPVGGPVASSGGAPGGQPLPLTLKMLVGISVSLVAFRILSLINITHVLAVSGVRSGITSQMVWSFILLRVARIYVLCGLLRRSRVCWWGVQLFNGYGLYAFVRSLIFSSSLSAGGLVSRSLAVFVEALFFAYLLLPSSRQIFFSKSKRNIE